MHQPQVHSLVLFSPSSPFPVLKSLLIQQLQSSPLSPTQHFIHIIGNNPHLSHLALNSPIQGLTRRRKGKRSDLFPNRQRSHLRHQHPQRLLRVLSVVLQYSKNTLSVSQKDSPAEKQVLVYLGVGHVPANRKHFGSIGACVDRQETKSIGERHMGALFAELQRVALKIGLYFSHFIDLPRLADLEQGSLFLAPAKESADGVALGGRRHNFDGFYVSSVFEEQVQCGSNLKVSAFGGFVDKNERVSSELVDPVKEEPFFHRLYSYYFSQKIAYFLDTGSSFPIKYLQFFVNRHKNVIFVSIKHRNFAFTLAYQSLSALYLTFTFQIDSFCGSRAKSSLRVIDVDDAFQLRGIHRCLNDALFAGQSQQLWFHLMVDQVCSGACQHSEGGLAREQSDGVGVEGGEGEERVEGGVKNAKITIVESHSQYLQRIIEDQHRRYHIF